LNTVYETFFYNVTQRTDDEQLKHSRMCPSVVDRFQSIWSRNIESANRRNICM